MSFSNVGTIHVEPKCTGLVMSEGGVNSANSIMYKNLKLENASAPGVMMPFEKRKFSAEVDFSDIPPGQRYEVTVRLDYGVAGDFRQIQKIYEVYDDGSGELEVFPVEDISPNG